LAECHYCGRRFPQLYKLTSEDIQKEHLPPIASQVACAECLDRVRLASRLLPEQSPTGTIRNLSWMILLLATVTASVVIATSVARARGLGEVGISLRWFGTMAVLVGTVMTWDRTKNRYAFTHDLKWSLSSKRVNFAFAIVLTGLVVLLVSVLLPV